MLYLHSTNNLARLLKITRKQTGKNLEDFSGDLCSVAHLSKIENEKFNPTNELLYNLFEYNGFKIKTDESIERQLIYLFEKFIKAVKIFDKATVNRLYIELQLYETKYNNHLGYIYHIKLMKLLYYFYFPNRRDKFNLITELSEFEFLFQDNYIKEYYKIMGYGTYFFNRYNEMKYFVFKLNDLFPHEPESSCLLGIYYVIRQETISALDCLKKAKEMYSVENRVIELAIIEMELAKIYFTEDLDKANMYFENSIKICETNHLQFIKEFIMNKLIVYLHTIGKFSIVIDKSNKLTYNTPLSDYPINMYCLLDSLYHLGKDDVINELLPKVKRELKNINSKYRSLYLQCWIHIYEDKDVEKFVTKNAFKKFQALNFDLPIYRLSYFLGIYFEEKHSYKKAMMSYKLAMRKCWHYTKPINKIKF